MGLEVAQAFEMVCYMGRFDFYKSMATHASNKI